MKAGQHSSSPRNVRVGTRVAAGPPHSIPVLCKFFAQGFCANGDSCRFLHPQPEDPAAHDSCSSIDFLARPQASDFVTTTPDRRTSEPEQAVTSSTDNHISRRNVDDREYVDFADAYASIFESDDQIVSRTNESADWNDRVLSDQLSSLSLDSQRKRHFVTSVDEAQARSSYAAATAATLPRDESVAPSMRPRWEYVHVPFTDEMSSTNGTLCKYHMDGTCRYGQTCMYLHGTFCSTCQKNILHPTNNDLAAKHVAECASNSEKSAHMLISRNVDCGKSPT